MATNLPLQTTNNSSQEVKQFFDKYYINQISFPSSQIDAVVGFFLQHGFDPESARSTGIVLLNQAREDSVNVFELIDTTVPVSDILLSLKCSTPDPFGNLFALKYVSLPRSLYVSGPINRTDEVTTDWF